MSITKVRLSGRQFHHRVGRDTHFRVIFSIFIRSKGVEYVQFALTYKRGQYTKDHGTTMRDLRKYITLPPNSREFKDAALQLLYKQIFETVSKRERHTKLDEALSKRLTAVARELQLKEKTRSPLKGEVLLVTVPFDEHGAAGIPNTHRVALNKKDPMMIIGDTVRNVVMWTTMIYANAYKIAGLEEQVAHL